MTGLPSLRLALFTDSYPPQINGVSLLLERLVRAINERDGEVRVFTTTDPHAEDDPSILRWPSMAFWNYPEHRIALPSQWSVRRELRDWRPTLVHAASPFGVGLAGRWAARALGIPFVASYHTNWAAYASYYLAPMRPMAWAYLRWFHNGAARTYAPTRATQTELRQHGFRRTAIWSRGVDTQRFSPTHRSDDLRAQLGVGPGDLLAIYVGRLGAEKRLDVAFEGLKHAARLQGPGDSTRIVCAVAGDGPNADAYRRQAPPGTVFVGRLTGRDLSAFYASADLFLFPSTTDTFGNVLLEAMASGVPAVGADVGPTQELLSAGGGITFPRGDSQALGRCLIELARSPDRRATLRARALAFAGACTWERVFDELFADYARVSTDHAMHSETVNPAALLNPLRPPTLPN